MPDYHPPAAAWPVGPIHCSARLKTRPHLPPEMDKINDDGWTGGNMTVQSLYLRSVGLSEAVKCQHNQTDYTGCTYLKPFHTLLERLLCFLVVSHDGCLTKGLLIPQYHEGLYRHPSNLLTVLLVILRFKLLLLMTISIIL